MQKVINKAHDLDGQSFKNEFLKSRDAVLLDVGSPIEFFEGTIADARNMDYMDKDFERDISYLDPNKTYFVFCRNGNRSAAACKEMLKRGLRVFNLTKGMGDWPE